MAARRRVHPRIHPQNKDEITRILYPLQTLRKVYRLAVKNKQQPHLQMKALPHFRRKHPLKRLLWGMLNLPILHRQKKAKVEIRKRLPTVTAAPRSPTPPPLFCFFLLLRVRLLLRWWPRESEGERAVHRPHTLVLLSLCVCPLAWTLALTSPHRSTHN
ncbi:putative mucin-associated surface protein (MASP) [Trypanosoma cruzi]|nr:putative mucin-associated surface protein (MASP) [Trypanosoma cruzi]